MRQDSAHTATNSNITIPRSENVHPGPKPPPLTTGGFISPAGGFVMASQNRQPQPTHQVADLCYGLWPAFNTAPVTSGAIYSTPSPTERDIRGP